MSLHARQAAVVRGVSDLIGGCCRTVYSPLKTNIYTYTIEDRNDTNTDEQNGIGLVSSEAWNIHKSSLLDSDIQLKDQA